ncbi:hypothetical protein B0T24DRAFT_652315 [Lasiosphaeria ovina]|uniref:FAD-binding PCMH-type domain-containing protein n=1 Tax=Lasiosphaeria ovina TaxID=92902 RepID=A0AAE0JWG4_9PEZI|nr:hypothetical protein B0T24DRAFT_652315 [Lasiosphaeria ovina]
MAPLPAVQLKILLVSVLLTLTSAVPAGFPLAVQKPLCKVIPGTLNWPSAESWNRLNEPTGGRLLRPPPPGAVCHPGQPTYDAAECPAVLAGWSTFEFHQADPISTDWNQWNNDSCLPQQADPYSGQGYPVFVINTTTPEHIKLGVNFASEHNIRLVVKSSGHDYLGRSVAPNSLYIWVHRLKGLETHSSFRPQSCNVDIEASAVTAGAGSQMFELYSALDALNQTTVGGNRRTVSLGGYLTGGGHSILAPRYSLAADQVLEMELVTPTGDIVTANQCQNQDLFWAMRGIRLAFGGCSTFGILISATIKTFPSPQIVATPYIFDVVAYVLAQYPSLSDRGVSGYSFFFQALPTLFDGGATTVGGIYMQMNLQDSTVEAMAQLWEPIFEHINSTWPGFHAGFTSKNYTPFNNWFLDYLEVAEAGVDRLVGSRLLGADVLTANLTLNAEVFKRFATSGVGAAYLMSGKGVQNTQPRGGGNAALPAWGWAYVHAVLGQMFEPLNATARAEAFELVNYALDPMRELAPDSGAYMNEADPQEPDWQHQFWGSHYDRLVYIKRAIDPEDVLWCNPCVGNERWKEVGDQLYQA